MNGCTALRFGFMKNVVFLRCISVQRYFPIFKKILDIIDYLVPQTVISSNCCSALYEEDFR